MQPPADTRRADPWLADPWLATMDHSVRRGHTVKEAVRVMAASVDPDMTEGEYDDLYDEKVEPLVKGALAHQRRVAAMAPEDRTKFIVDTAKQHGVELSPELKLFLFQMLSTPPPATAAD